MLNNQNHFDDKGTTLKLKLQLPKMKTLPGYSYLITWAQLLRYPTDNDLIQLGATQISNLLTIGKKC